MTALALTGKLGVFGIGYTDLSHALSEGLVWQVAGVLLLAKWLATVACYSSGGCGGIFSPCLFFGAMCGTMLTGWFGQALALSPSDRVLARSPAQRPVKRHQHSLGRTHAKLECGALIHVHGILGNLALQALCAVTCFD
jgi:hypothetical protein